MEEAKKLETIDEYISEYPADKQKIMQEIRELVHKELPEVKEKISWQMPTFQYHGNLIHFAAHNKHIGLYPGPSAITYFQEGLHNYKTSKGAIQLPLDQPIPYELIKNIIHYSAEENIKFEEEKNSNKNKER